MDRLIFTALNTIQSAQENSIVRSNNLANATVPGFRKDLEPKVVKTSFLDAVEEFETRAFALREGKNRFSREEGRIDYTEQPTDLAIRGEGFFVIQPKSGGEPALSRRGDFRIDATGVLSDGAGNQLLNAQGQPFAIPPFRELYIGDTGLVSIEPVGGEPGELVEVGQIATSLASGSDLKKFPDGHIRARDGSIPPTDQESRLVQGYLESSNVNTVEELVENLRQQRAYELNVKMISMARELDESGASLMRMPN